MEVKRDGFERDCETCPHPKLNEQNAEDVEVVWMIRQAIMGMNVSIPEIFDLYYIPEYRRLEILRKTIKLQAEIGKADGGNS